MLAMVPAWLGLAGSWFWLFDILANFRWQYLVASAVAVPWALWQRQRHLLAFALLTLLLNAVLIGRLAWQPEAWRAEPAFTLRIISLNVLTSNTNHAAVFEYLQRSDADLVFLMEVDARWLEDLHPLEARYPHHLAEPRDNNFGVAFYSRVPLEQVDLIALGEAGLPAVQARLIRQGRELVVIGTHTLPPGSREWSRLRDEQLRALATHVESIALPVVVVGDFNATPWSAALGIATSGRLGYRSIDAPWVPTWSARSVFAIPIDHALCTAPLFIARSIGPDVGSDHRPLEIVVNVQAQALQRP